MWWKITFGVSGLPYAVPAGEQGVGRRRAAVNIMIVLFDWKKMCGKTGAIKEASQSVRFCRPSLSRNNVIVRKDFLEIGRYKLFEIKRSCSTRALKFAKITFFKPRVIETTKSLSPFEEFFFDSYCVDGKKGWKEKSHHKLFKLLSFEQKPFIFLWGSV